MQLPPQIKDDVAVVDTAYKKTQKQFITGKTKPIAYRISQLINLKNGIATMQKDLSDAVQKDLGRESFSTWFTEISLIEKELEHTLQHI
jgi:aldehyde dehydrogenase (NAD+)